MKTKKQSDGWWITDVPAYRVDGAMFTICGPYTTCAEAEDGRRGLQRFYRDNPPTLDVGNMPHTLRKVTPSVKQSQRKVLFD